MLHGTCVGGKARARNLVFFRVKWLQPAMKGTSCVRRLRVQWFQRQIGSSVFCNEWLFMGPPPRGGREFFHVSAFWPHVRCCTCALLTPCQVELGGWGVGGVITFLPTVRSGYLRYVSEVYMFVVDSFSMFLRFGFMCVVVHVRC